MVGLALTTKKLVMVVNTQSTIRAEQVKKVRQAGVGVLSYFISDGYYGSSKSYFEQMYGKDSEFINVDNMTQLAKTLNKKFEVKI